MPKKGKNKAKSGNKPTLDQIDPPEQVHSVHVTEPDFDEYNPAYQAVLSHSFNDLLSRCSKSIPEDMRTLINTIITCHEEKTTLPSDEIEASFSQLEGCFKIFSDVYKAVQQEHFKLLDLKQNLFQVNQKLLQKLKNQNGQHFQKTFEDKGTQVSEFSNVDENNSSGTQMQIGSIQTPYNIVANSYTSETQELQDTSLNKSFGLNDSKSFNESSLIRIIIYKLNQDLDVPDILIAVHKISDCPYPLIEFVKKQKLKNLDRYNYIVELQSDIAKILISRGYIQIREQKFTVLQHINVIRCFRCQQFNHLQYSCTKAQVCARCGGPHDFVICKNSPRCINCVNNNNKNKHNFSVDHPTCYSECESRKLFISQTRRLLHAPYL